MQKAYWAFSLLLLLPPFAGKSQVSSNVLWYKEPAREWTEALPVGNGRLGAMVFGGVGEELIQLNESTLWSGGPVPKVINPDAVNHLPEIRKVLLEGDFDKASALAKKMQGLFTESYMPLGNLVINQQFKDTTLTQYNRDLNLGSATSSTSFTVGGESFTRSVFASSPDQVIVVWLTALKPATLQLKIGARSPLKHTMLAAANNELVMKGRAPSHADPSYYNKNREPIIWDDSTGSNCTGMRYEMIVKAVNTGGTVSTDTSGITIKGASSVVL
ncbi:MAG TPA: glycoside hydrolase family 95 protein, partial [Niastella sp.]|nr:glycoside hydrolase family 95 protein [Niastella sp.]